MMRERSIIPNIMSCRIDLIFYGKDPSNTNESNSSSSLLSQDDYAKIIADEN